MTDVTRLRNGAAPASRFDPSFERAAFIAAMVNSALRGALQSLLEAATTDDLPDAGSGHLAAAWIGTGLEGRRVAAWRLERPRARAARRWCSQRENAAGGQRVAIKTLQHGLLAAYERERVIRERAILALEHPHIARPRDGGLPLP